MTAPLPPVAPPSGCKGGRGRCLPSFLPGAWRCDRGLLWWEAALEGARVVFTTRVGGASLPPFDTLNLGLHVGDVPEAVLANRRAVASALGVPGPVVAEQVHGADVGIVGAGDAGRGWGSRGSAVGRVDALVTREAGVAPAILIADCAPVALLSPGGVLGVAHAGWRGLVAGVLEAALRQMAALGGGPAETCRAVVGPCIRACCYEVGEPVWRRFPTECLAPGDRPASRRLDLMAAVLHRLRDAGLPPERVHAAGLCTGCHTDLFFSHRRATRAGLPATGRTALLVWRS